MPSTCWTPMRQAFRQSFAADFSKKLRVIRWPSWNYPAENEPRRLEMRRGFRPPSMNRPYSSLSWPSKNRRRRSRASEACGLAQLTEFVVFRFLRATSPLHQIPDGKFKQIRTVGACQFLTRATQIKLLSQKRRRPARTELLTAMMWRSVSARCLCFMASCCTICCLARRGEALRP
jgi:hypothetical protein